MSAWVYVAAATVMGVGGFVAVVGFTRGQPIRRQPVPQAQTLTEESGVFAAELRAIDVPAGPNYVSGEYPLVARHAAVEDEAAVAAEPVEVEPEPEPQYPGPWWAQPTVALPNERTPIFHESGSYPVLDLDLSATNSWNRAALRALLDMPEEEAA